MLYAIAMGQKKSRLKCKNINKKLFSPEIHPIVNIMREHRE